MTKQEIEDKYFHDFLVWCTIPLEGTASELIFWIDHHAPTLDNFWEWVVFSKLLKP